MKWSSTQELINMMEEQQLELAKRIEVLKAGFNSFDEEVIFKYIETRSTIKTAAFIKSKGIRSPKGTVYAGGDVSNLIKNDNKNVNPVLHKMALEIFKKNTKAVNRAYN